MRHDKHKGTRTRVTLFTSGARSPLSSVRRGRSVAGGGVVTLLLEVLPGPSRPRPQTRRVRDCKNSNSVFGEEGKGCDYVYEVYIHVKVSLGPDGLERVS